MKTHQTFIYTFMVNLVALMLLIATVVNVAGPIAAGITISVLTGNYNWLWLMSISCFTYPLTRTIYAVSADTEEEDS
jgi:hypothetical protein